MTLVNLKGHFIAEKDDSRELKLRTRYKITPLVQISAFFLQFWCMNDC